VAIPKVFISSTCFDLSEIREQLKRFVRSFGFEPVLSEHGDVFYHPDLHTHEACVHEVSNCQLFILIIGGRFGGTYTLDKSKSITNAEYDAARTANIPVFTYVRGGVLGNHHIYRENRSKKFVSEINYPAVDKQDDAENIFKFIDDVRRAPTNNAFEGFDNFNDIEVHLRKQWAGMFFDFLKTREIKNQIDATNHFLNNLKGSNEKLESLVKSLYLSTSSNSSDAQKSITDIEIQSNVKKFFESLLDFGSDSPIDVTELGLAKEFDPKKLAKISPQNITWHEYLVKLGLFYREQENDIYFHTHEYGLVINDEEDNHKEKRLSFEKGVQKSTKEQRTEILSELIR
jgi:hypothetical protein